MNTKKIGIPQPDDDVVNKEPNVLLIGYGWVGQYMGKYFKNAHYVTNDGIIYSQDEEVVFDTNQLPVKNFKGKKTLAANTPQESLITIRYELYCLIVFHRLFQIFGHRLLP